VHGVLGSFSRVEVGKAHLFQVNSVSRVSVGVRLRDILSVVKVGGGLGETPMFIIGANGRICFVFAWQRRGDVAAVHAVGTTSLHRRRMEVDVQV
jgi:hypothetical protein